MYNTPDNNWPPVQALPPARSMRSPKLRPSTVRTPAPPLSDTSGAGSDADDDSLHVMEANSTPSRASPALLRPSPRGRAPPARPAPPLAHTPPRQRRQTARAAAAAAMSEGEDEQQLGQGAFGHEEGDRARLVWPNGELPSPPKGLASGLFYLDAAASALEPGVWPSTPALQ